MRHCQFVDLKDALDREAEMFRSQFITGLRDNDSKRKLLEVLGPNGNLTVEKLLQLIQHRTQAKRFAESSIHQSTSSVFAYAEKRGPDNKKRSELPSVRSQSCVDGVDLSHSTHVMSASLRLKSVTIVRSRDTTPESAKLKDKKPRELRGKPTENQMHKCRYL